MALFIVPDGSVFAYRGVARLRRSREIELLGLVPAAGREEEHLVLDLLQQSSMPDVGIYSFGVFPGFEGVGWVSSHADDSAAVCGRYELGDDAVFHFVDLVSSASEQATERLTVVEKDGGAVTITSHTVEEWAKGSAQARQPLEDLERWFRTHAFHKIVDPMFEGARPGMRLLFLKTTKGLRILEREWQLTPSSPGDDRDAT